MTAPAGTHVALFDLYTSGHHLGYCSMLAEAWARAGHAEHGHRLSLVLPPSARPRLDAFPALRALTRCPDATGVHLALLPEEPHLAPPGTPFRLLRHDAEHARHLRTALDGLRPDHAVLMYLDRLQLSLAFGLRRRVPARLSGVLFRPEFHYDALGGPTADAGTRLRRVGKQLLLTLALRNPHLHTLFSLDPYVVGPLRQTARRLGADVRIEPLPDGIVQAPGGQEPEHLRARLGIEPGRRVALLFGSLDGRKGLFQTLKAAQRLPAGAQRRLALVLAGPIAGSTRARAEPLLADLRRSPLQVATDFRFLPDADVQPLVGAADLVLLPYQHHVGSSGVLIRAAAAGAPVLATDFGLVGAQVRRHRLGRTIDATSPAALAGALTAWLADPSTIRFDPTAAERFAQAHTAEAMAAALFDPLLEA